MNLLEEYSPNQQLFIINTGILILKEIIPLYKQDNNHEEILLSETLRRKIIELEENLEDERV